MERFELAGLGVVLGALAAPWPGVALVVWGFAALVVLGRGSAGLGAGGLVGCLAVASVGWGPAVRGPMVVVGRVEGTTVGRTADVRVGRMAVDGVWSEGRGRVRVLFPDRAPPPGSEVLLAGRGVAIGGGAMPGSPDPVVGAVRARIRTLVIARRAERLGGRGPLPPAVHPLLLALATGDRSQLDPADVGLLRRTGTAHLLAISGFHVGAVAAMAVGAARLLLGLVAVVRPRGVDRRWAWLTGALVAAAFAASVGWPVSARRAALLVALLAVAKSGGRVARGSSLLAVVATAVVVHDPAAVGTAAFQLSFGAVAGLLGWGCRLADACPRCLNRAGTWVWNAMSGSTAATLGTLPAAAWWFQQLSPTSPLANVVAMPWTAILLVPSAMTAVFAPAPIAGWAARAGSASAEGLLWALAWFDVAPWHPAVGPAGAALLAASLVCCRVPGVAVWAIVVALGLRLTPAGPAVLTFLDVGHGDATLVEHGDGRVWLVDGGRSGGRLVAWLRRRGVRHLDAVVVSHPHADHVGGLVAVVRGLEVEEVWVGQGPTSAELDAAVFARQVPMLRAPVPTLQTEGCRGNANDGSLVVAVRAGGGALLTGDLEACGEREMGPRVGHAEVLKVPHHGSPTSSTPLFIDAVAPSLAVLSTGLNRGRPVASRAVADRYWRAGAVVLRTDLDGVIRVRLGHETEVDTWRAGRGWLRRSSGASTASPMLRGRPDPAPGRSPATSSAAIPGPAP